MEFTVNGNCDCFLVSTQEAVQRLFKPPTQSKDEFTVWCESFLGGMDVQIDSKFTFGHLLVEFSFMLSHNRYSLLYLQHFLVPVVILCLQIDA